MQKKKRKQRFFSKLNTARNTFWISTGLITLIVIGVFIDHIFINPGSANEATMRLGYPSFITYPLLGAQLLAIAAILFRRFPILSEWAYAGLFFNFILAFLSHLYARDSFDLLMQPILTTFLLLVSYLSRRQYLFDK